MSVVLDKRFIFFSSASSSNGYVRNPTSLQVRIDPTQFQLTDPDVYYRYWISDITMRNDFLAIGYSNRQFNYNGTLISLKEGKPSIYDIIADLGQYGIVCSYDTDTNYLVFHTASSYTLDFTPTNSAATLLGFDTGETYTITDGFMPPNQIDIAIDVVFIQSNMTTDNSNVVNGSTQYTNIIGSVSILANPYQILNYNDSVGLNAVIERNRTMIQDLQISFVDIDGFPLTLNSQFFATICIEYVVDYQLNIIKELQLLNQVITQQFNFQKRESMLKHLRKPPPKTIKSKK